MSTITRRASLRKQARDNLLNLDEAIELIVALEIERDEARAEIARQQALIGSLMGGTGGPGP